MLDKDQAKALLDDPTRRTFLAATGSMTAILGIAGGELGGDDSGSLTGGTMALEQAYKVAEADRTIYVGPDSAKGEITPDDGDKYDAVDTQVSYYGDGGGWNRMGIGSEEQPVPAVHTDEETINGPVAGWDGQTRTGYDSIQAAINDGNKEIELLADVIEEHGITFDLAFALTDTLKIKSVGKRTTIQKPTADSTPILDPEDSNASSRLILERIQLGGDPDGSKGNAAALNYQGWQGSLNRSHRWELRQVRSRLPVLIFGADEPLIDRCAFFGDQTVNVDYGGSNYDFGGGLWLARANNGQISQLDVGANAPTSPYGIRTSDTNSMTYIEVDAKNSDKNDSGVAQWRSESDQNATFINCRGTGPSSSAPNDFEFGLGPDTGQSGNAIEMLNVGFEKIKVDAVEGLQIRGVSGGPSEIENNGGLDILVENSVGPLSETGTTPERIVKIPGKDERVGPDNGTHREISGGFTVSDGTNEILRVDTDGVQFMPNGLPKPPILSDDPVKQDLADKAATFYVSDGSTGVTGDAGDFIVAINDAGTVKTKIVADLSAL